MTSTSLATYPSSNQGRSLIFRTSYNFVIGRSYNIRLDEGMPTILYNWTIILFTYALFQGVAVDNTYCGLNSTAITSSSFWSVTVGKLCGIEIFFMFVIIHWWNSSLQLCVSVGWWGLSAVVAMILRGEWRCVLMEAGGQCAMMDGAPLMPECSADNSTSQPLVWLCLKLFCFNWSLQLFFTYYF